MRPSFQAVAALALLALAGAALWIGVGGIIDGQVTVPTAKRESYEFFRDASPKAFWACAVIWIAAGCGFTWLALINLREASRRY
jgi:hypothetical protein